MIAHILLRHRFNYFPSFFPYSHSFTRATFNPPLPLFANHICDHLLLALPPRPNVNTHHSCTSLCTSMSSMRGRTFRRGRRAQHVPQARSGLRDEDICTVPALQVSQKILPQTLWMECMYKVNATHAFSKRNLLWISNIHMYTQMRERECVCVCVFVCIHLQ